MEHISRRGLLKAAGATAAGIAGVAAIGKVAMGQPPAKQADDVAGRMAIAKLNQLHARVKSGAAQASDYVVAATALGIASEQWEASGASAAHQKAVQEAMAANPGAQLSAGQIHQAYLMVAAAGSPATEEEVRARLFASDEQHRKAAALFAGDSHAIVHMHRQIVQQLLDTGKRIERAAARGIHADLRQANEWDICASIAVLALYSTIIGIACPPCAPVCVIIDVICGIAGILCL